MELSYAFIIFFISLGPLKVIPLFYKLTAQDSDEDIRKIALKGTLAAIVLVLLIGLIADQLLRSWKISLSAFVMAGGILLFLTSVKNIMKFKGLKILHASNEVAELKEESKPSINQKALSPVAIPIIISPIGVVATVAILSMAHIDSLLLEAIGVLVVIMVMNLVSMVFARPILKVITLPVFSILGWVFSILQAGLAIQFIVNSIHKLFGI